MPRLAYIILLAMTLVGAVGLQCFPARESAAAVRLPALGEFLPKQVAGWTVNDVPLGETEAQEGAVRGILRYDDALLRNYTRSGLTIGVHVVYWRPESGGPGGVRSHSPDFCFPAAGWRCVATDYERVLTMEHWKSLPGQLRKFEAGGRTVEVIFWHLRGKELSGCLMGEQSRWRARVPLLLRQFWRGFPGGLLLDETFVRITTTGDISALTADPLLAELAAALEKTGVFKRIGAEGPK